MLCYVKLTKLWIYYILAIVWMNNQGWKRHCYTYWQTWLVDLSWMFCFLNQFGNVWATRGRPNNISLDRVIPSMLHWHPYNRFTVESKVSLIAGVSTVCRYTAAGFFFISISSLYLYSHSHCDQGQQSVITLCSSSVY